MAQQKIDFFRSAAGPVRPASFFFYHIPKCGGMTIHTLVRTCWDQIAKHEGFPTPLVARADDDPSVALLRGHPYALISSHLPYGAHDGLVGSPLLLTILRDPVGRVRSAYAYHCMHHGEAVDPAGFEAFVQREENQNTMVRLLSGLAPDATVGPAARDRACATLTQKFALFATTRDIPTICETILQACTLPNVIAAHINQTPDQYDIDAAPFAETIVSANTHDVDLFQYVDAHKKCALNADGGNRSVAPEHPFTVMLVEQHHAEEMRAKGFMVPTAFLREIKLLREDASIDGDIHRDFIRSVRDQGALD